MARLKLQPDPTFTAKVEIPVPGADPVSVEFTFKHRNRAQLKAFAEAMNEREDVDIILDMAKAWELEDVFNKESVGLLVANYFAAPRAIFDAYLAELTKAKQKN